MRMRASVIEDIRVKGRDVPCLISASRRKSIENMLEKPNGSKPTSPGAEPSSLAGRSMNGTDGLASMEKRALAGAGQDEVSWEPRNEAGRRAPENAETKATIVRGDGMGGEDE